MVKSQRKIEFENQLEINDKQKNSLNSIRDQMKELKLEPYLGKNLKNAIEHFEWGDFLASALISSRIIVYGINKIPSKTEDSGDKVIFKGSIDEKIKFLREKDIIGKGQSDKKLNIVKYVKKARDFLVHDIKRFPDASESMALLGDCLDILKILKKLKEV